VGGSGCGLTQNLSQYFHGLQTSIGHPVLRLRYEHGTFHTLDKGDRVTRTFETGNHSLLYIIDDKYHFLSCSQKGPKNMK